IPSSAPPSGRRQANSVAPASIPRGFPAAPSEGQLEPRRQRQACRQTGHFFLRCGFDLAHGVVDRGGDEILEHVLVFAEEALIDGHALDVVAAGHHHLDQPGTRLALDLHRGDRLLRFFHAVLHRLRLLHQAGQLIFHHRCQLRLSRTRLIEFGLMRASKRDRTSWTNGSSRNAASVFAWAASRSRFSCAASVVAAAPPISNRNRTRRPRTCSIAVFSLSAYARSVKWRDASGTAKTNSLPATALSSVCAASCNAMPDSFMPATNAGQ